MVRYNLERHPNSRCFISGGCTYLLRTNYRLGPHHHGPNAISVHAGQLMDYPICSRGISRPRYNLYRNNLQLEKRPGSTQNRIDHSWHPQSTWWLEPPWITYPTPRTPLGREPIILSKGDLTRSPFTLFFEGQIYNQDLNTKGQMRDETQ